MLPLNRVKYFYFFRGNIAFGVHFFESWVNAVQQEGIPMKLITFLSLKNYIRFYGKIREYRRKDILIYFDLPLVSLSKVYFFTQALFCKRLVIHLKKRDPKYFDWLKLILPNKVLYVFEGEGDPKSEIDYLKKHPYKDGFYDSDLESLKIAMQKQEMTLKNADLCTFGYPSMRLMLEKRYPAANLKHKIALIPMSFSKNTLVFEKEKRDFIRSKLNIENKFVYMYIGNAYYSWQNVYRTIEIFKYIKENHDSKSFLILLIKKTDFPIVKEFLKKLELKTTDYMLDSVDHDEISSFLSAADVGVVLRHNHIMNETTPPGKILDYLACGLPVLTTEVIGKTFDFIDKMKFGIVLKDMDDNCEIMEKLDFFNNVNEDRRREISVWANENLSTSAHIKKYTKTLEAIVNAQNK